MTLNESAGTNKLHMQSLLEALNSAAIQLQRSARSEADIYLAFYEHMTAIGLTGSISLLSEDGKYLTVKVLVILDGKLRDLEGLPGSQAVDLRILLSASRLFSRVMERRKSVFTKDISDELKRVIPQELPGLREDVISSLAGQAAIFCPLIIDGHVRGVLTVNGREVNADDIPAIETYAFQTAIALENTRLLNTMQLQLAEGKQAKDALQASELKYRSIVQQSRDGIVLVDEQGRIIEWNDAQERITGIPQSQALGRLTWEVEFELFPNIDPSHEYEKQILEETKKLLEAGVSPGVGQPREQEILRKDGKRRTVEVVSYPLKTEQGYRICSIVRDMTERKEMERALLHRAEELAAIQEQSIELTTIHELPVLLKKIVERAVLLLGAKGGSLYLCEPEHRRVRKYVEISEGQQEYLDTTLKYGEGAAGGVALSGRPLIVDDYRTWSGRAKAYENTSDFTGVLTVPMIWQGEVTGVLQVLEDINFRKFTLADQELLGMFASHAAVAVETTRLLEAERRRRQEAETLGKAAAALTTTLELNQLLESILTHLEQVVPYSTAAIFLLKEKRLEIVAARGFPDPDRVVGTGFTASKDKLFVEIQREARSVILADARRDPRFHAYGGVQHVRGWLGVPLIVRGKVIGCLTLDSQKPGIYNASHAALAEVFANQAATAIERARLFEAERTAREQAEATRDAASVISSSLSINQVLEAVLEQLWRVLPFDSGNIMLVENERAVIKVWRGYAGENPAELVEKVSFDISQEHSVGAVVKSGESLMLADVRQDPRWQETAISSHIRSWLGVPLKVRGRVIGLFNLDRSTDQGFSEDEIALAQTFAAHAAAAIENARLFEQAAIERRHLQLLYEINRSLASSLDMNEILERAISLTCQELGGLAGQAFLYLPEDDRLRLCALYGKEGIDLQEINNSLDIRPGVGLAGWVIQHRQPVYVLDVTQDDRWLHVGGLDEGVHSAMVAPILYGDRLYGVLSVLHHQWAAFSTDHLDLLVAICQETGLALSNADRYQQMDRRLAEMTLIQSLAQIFTERLDLRILLDEVVSQLYERFNFPLVEIFLTSGDQLVLQAYRGRQPEVLVQPISQGIVGRAARTGEVNLIPDTSKDPDYYSVSPDTVAELAVPICQGDTVVGVINIETHLPNQLSEHDRDLLKVLAGQISIAIDNAVLYEEVRSHAQELEKTVIQRTAELVSLYELSQNIGFTLSYEDLMRLLLSHLKKALGADLSSCCLITDGYRLVYVEASRSISTDSMQTLRKYCKTSLSGFKNITQKLETTPVELIRSGDFNADSPAIDQIASLIHAPIIVGRKTVGILIAGRERDEEYKDSQKRLLETFAHQAATAIERITVLLAAEHRRLESLLENLPIGVMLLDSDYRLLISNPLGKEILSQLYAEIKEGVLTSLADYPVEDLVRRYRDPLPVELVSEGSPLRFFEAQVRPVGESNLQWALTVREVTQERENLARIQMQDRLATVGQLAAGIAHDFNNIMAAILVYADLLMNDPSLSRAGRDRLAIIEQQVQRAASLIRQILDFSRRAVMEQSSLDLLPFIKELERMLGRVIPETIRLELAYKPGIYTVNADPTRLQQVFINLAVNARDAMPQGGVLHFSIEHFTLDDGDTPPIADLPAGTWVRITVRDTGVGIPPEVLPHIYEPFFTTKPVGHGTGLGLAQVYGIVKQHGGYIDVSSRVGEGTEFTIYLPAILDVKYERRQTEPLALLDGTGKVIMVVEDDDATLAALRALLESKNYDVITARDGFEALRQFEQSSQLISLVVSDVVMPQMDGLALYKAIQTRDPEMKILFVTGHPLEGESQALLEGGEVHWLQKPFSAREFTRVVQHLLEV